MPHSLRRRNYEMKLFVEGKIGRFSFQNIRDCIVYIVKVFLAFWYYPSLSIPGLINSWKLWFHYWDRFLDEIENKLPNIINAEKIAMMYFWTEVMIDICNILFAVTIACSLRKTNRYIIPLYWFYFSVRVVEYIILKNIYFTNTIKFPTLIIIICFIFSIFDLNNDNTQF